MGLRIALAIAVTCANLSASAAVRIELPINSARFAHLLDEAKRRELMIIYSEDLSLGEMRDVAKRALQRVSVDASEDPRGPNGTFRPPPGP